MTEDERLAKIEQMEKDLAYVRKQFPEVFDYHMYGKIETGSQANLKTKRDLSLAYSPGVALPCLEIFKKKGAVYDYTRKGNLVAVISNGTAVLGLGNLGPRSSKPVMEGKAILLKQFAGIDSYDIEVQETDPKKFIEVVKAISPTFGGINLEDIKAPECFEIEETLDRDLNMPVMHDDQHGTAMVCSAAMINACEISGKKMENLKVVVYGAGSAAMGCARLFKEFGVHPDNVIMFDSKGAITADRKDLNEYKQRFVTHQKVTDIYDALKGADALIGLSVANCIPTDAIKGMAKDPMIFCMSNPVPELDMNLAKELRPDAILGTGRSDLPNQVNNLLAFPYMFRGALTVRSKVVNNAMKMAAASAIAEVARMEPTIELQRLIGKDIKYGKDYIIPTPFDPRLRTVSNAVAKAAIDSGAAGIGDIGKVDEH